MLIVSGRLYDEAFRLWLEPGHYASRPSGQVHGPFRREEGCLVLDVSYPQRSVGTGNQTLSMIQALLRVCRKTISQGEFSPAPS
jgi:hypothetical protein